MDQPSLQSQSSTIDDEPGETKHSSAQDLGNLRFIDIGSNLGDPVFRGDYYGKRVHPDDFHRVLSRARSAGVAKQILTGDCLIGSQQVKDLAHQNEGLYATVGCHPCRANEFEANAKRDSNGEDLEESLTRSAAEYLNGLDRLIADDLASDHPRVVAVGECGLDYDRLSHCSKEIQLRYFPPQLELATKYKLPLFLHSRTSEAHVDFVRIFREHEAAHSSPEILPARKKGVVHSFTGMLEEMHELIELGLSIGVNGCSLKTGANLEVVKAIPLDRIMLETDCPWCEIRPSHASHAYLTGIPHPERFLPSSIKKEKYRGATEDHRFEIVKGRNEPCTIGQVAWIVSQLKMVSLEALVEHAWENSTEMFGLC